MKWLLPNIKKLERLELWLEQKKGVENTKDGISLTYILDIKKV